MVKKKYCDFCGKEIDLDLSDQIEIYNHAKEDYEFQKDACEKCKKNILAFLTNLNKNVK